MADFQDNPFAADGPWIRTVRERLRALPAEAGTADIETLRDRLASLPWLAGCPEAALLARAGGAPQQRRHRIARDAGNGCTALLIAWPPGHRTPLHDHDGLWGIELVLEGALAIEEFRKDESSGATRLDHERTRILGIGDAISFTAADYVHACRNLSARRPALSLHVYGGELDAYSAFHTDTCGLATATRRRAGLDAVLI